MNARRAPVVVIGMHRSGTSLVARLLESSGIHMGWRKEHNHEAVFFLAVNDWMLSLAGTTWERPTEFRFLLDNETARSQAISLMRGSLRSPRVLGYLGPAGLLRSRSLSHIPFAWGWKDPRNTVTLPLWLELFPDARIIHVRRHGLDVAESLKKRSENKLAWITRNLGWLKLYCGFRLRPSYLFSSLRSHDLAQGVALWEEYLALAESSVRKLGDRAHDIRYEDLLEDPENVLADLVRFCGLSCSERQIRAAVAGIDADRAFAHRNDPQLLELADGLKDRLARWGY